MKNLAFFLFLLSSLSGKTQMSIDTSEHELSLIFIGDVMGHGPQITSAYDEEKKAYDYNSVFQYIAPVMQDADYTIANLEVTLAGPPYKGYPQFSSPDELAVACKDAGVDIMVTSNNHTCDRGGKGIVRTVQVLDSLGFMRTGSFCDSTDRKHHTPLIIENDCFRIAILNYTYGTNGLNFPEPTIVNLLDKDIIAADMEKAKASNVDKIIVVTHWGLEYKREPVQSQIAWGEYIFDQGADIVIGSHPHVLEKMVLEKSTNDGGKEELITYSLGNFVSNQRKPRTDGGALFKLTLGKKDDQCYIKNSGYILSWVYTPIEEGKKKYYILPASQYENDTAFFDSMDSFNQMQAFIKDSRELFNEQNVNVPEYIYQNEKWILNQ
ncbi:MAG: CapA family protein [Crocinitomicaceae bacterium]|nr:CapA family protein [Crocinitomicaceae bacterium]